MAERSSLLPLIFPSRRIKGRFRAPALGKIAHRAHSGPMPGPPATVPVTPQLQLPLHSENVGVSRTGQAIRCFVGSPRDDCRAADGNRDTELALEHWVRA